MLQVTLPAGRAAVAAAQAAVAAAQADAVVAAIAQLVHGAVFELVGLDQLAAVFQSVVVAVDAVVTAPLT